MIFLDLQLQFLFLFLIIFKFFITSVIYNLFVIFEGNAKAVIESIVCSSSDLPWEFHYLRYLQPNSLILVAKFFFCYRSCNGLAHHLARWAFISLNWGSQPISSIPLWVFYKEVDRSVLLLLSLSFLGLCLFFLFRFLIPFPLAIKRKKKAFVYLSLSMSLDSRIVFNDCIPSQEGTNYIFKNYFLTVFLVISFQFSTNKLIEQALEKL